MMTRIVMKRGISKFFVGILTSLFLLYATHALAATVSMSWNANTDDDLAGYRVYYGTASGSYSYSIDAGNATTVEIGDLSASSTYYFIVTAYDTTGNESEPADEVSVTIPAQASTSTGGDTLSASSDSGGGGGGGGGCFIATANF